MRQVRLATLTTGAALALAPAGALAGGELPIAVFTSSPTEPASTGLRVVGVGTADVPRPGGGAPGAGAVNAARDRALARALGDAAARAARLAPRLGLPVGSTRGVKALPIERFAPSLRSVSAAVTVHFATAPVEGDLSVTVTGQASVVVRPSNRRSNASIRTAVAESGRLAAARAITDGQRLAARVAQGAGYTLTGLRSAEEGPEATFYAVYTPLAGTFGSGVYCGVTTRVVRSGGERRRVRRRTCEVPGQTTSSWTLVYAARPSAAPTG